MADIELETGETITAHCPNTGAMTGVCQVGSRVMVSRSDNPKRKLAYTWELKEVHDNGHVWAGVNTAMPNRAMRSALENRGFPELGPYETVTPEVRYGADRKSRIDFLLTGTPDQRPIYLEVKNTTWANGKQAMFPDGVTTRGQKHLRELTALIPEARAGMVYFINRGDCEKFSPGDASDPLYGKLLRTAAKKGVEILPCRFEITPFSIRYKGLAELFLENPAL